MLCGDFLGPSPIALQSHHPVDLKRIITTFTYRIEPKPEGGFIAHSSDPNVPPLEAPTREELQQKIQTTIAAAVAQQFPGLKLPIEGQPLKFDFHIEAKPGGGFRIHSHNSDANATPIEGATHADIELPFAGKIAGVLGKYFLPELSEALAKQGSGDIHVTVNKQISVTTSRAKTPFASLDLQPSGPQPQSAINGDFSVDASSNSPITHETNHTSAIFRFLLFLLAIGTVMYFFLRHR
jgi:hypothetical protein